MQTGSNITFNLMPVPELELAAHGRVPEGAREEVPGVLDRGGPGLR